VVDTVLPLSKGVDFRALLDCGGHVDHEVGRPERYLLLTGHRIGGRTAFKVDGAVLQQWNPVAGGDRLQVHLEVRHFQLGLDRIDDAHA
jgi:hypothetical protein